MNREVYLCGEINERSVTEIREQIMKFLREDVEKEITLFINSRGGEGTLAMSFYEWVKLKNIPLVTVAIGEIASAAMTVFLSGRKRKATSHSWFVIHQSPVLRSTFWKRFLTFPVHRELEYARLNIFKELEKEVLKKELKVSQYPLVFNAYKAKEIGLIDEIIQT